jgi:hypothetical protein
MAQPPFPGPAGPSQPPLPLSFSLPARPTAPAFLSLVGPHARAAQPPRRGSPAPPPPRPAHASAWPAAPPSPVAAQRVRAWSASAARPTAPSRPAARASARTHPRVERRHRRPAPRPRPRVSRAGGSAPATAWSVGPTQEARLLPKPNHRSNRPSRRFSLASRTVFPSEYPVFSPTTSLSALPSPPSVRCAASRPESPRRRGELARPLSPSPFSLSHRMRSLRPCRPSSRRSSSPARPRPAAAQLRGQQALRAAASLPSRLAARSEPGARRASPPRPRLVPARSGQVAAHSARSDPSPCRAAQAQRALAARPAALTFSTVAAVHRRTSPLHVAAELLRARYMPSSSPCRRSPVRCEHG